MVNGIIMYLQSYNNIYNKQSILYTKISFLPYQLNKNIILNTNLLIQIKIVIKYYKTQYQRPALSIIMTYFYNITY